MSTLRTIALLGLLVLSSAAHAAHRVAVVVGLGDYPGMPADQQVAGAREDAQGLARFLEDHGEFDTVHLMLDGVATRDGLTRLFLDVIAPTLQPGDLLLWAFVGHGYGDDFGDPYLALSEFQADDPEHSGLQLETFGPQLAERLVGVDIVIITDASHQAVVGGLAMRGPSARSWPPVRYGVCFLSANGPGETAPAGVFVPLLLQGLSGDADLQRDGRVTTSELSRFLTRGMAASTDGAVHVGEAGSCEDDLMISLVPPPSPMAPPAPLPAAPGRPAWRSRLSLGIAALGAGAAVGGYYAYTQGAQLCEHDQGKLVCYDSPDYRRWRTLSYVGYGVGVGLGTIGVALAF